MCKRLMVGIVSALAVMCGLAVPAGCLLAQSQAEYRARVEALAPIWRRVSAEFRHEDSLRVQALPKDTLRVGVFTILASPSLRELGRTAAAEAEVALRGRFGESAEEVRTHRFTLTWPTDGRIDSTVVEIAEIDSLGRLAQSSGVAATSEAVRGSLAQRGSRILTDRFGQGFTQWLHGSIPTDTATHGDWVGVRIDLVTSAFQMSRECYAGNIRSCERALGVTDESEPAREWFSPAERRDMVQQDSYRLRRGQEDAFEQCVIHKVDAECLMLAAQIPIREVQVPLGPASRQSLVRLAMQIGGAQAYARMRRALGTRGGQLEAASGISIDSLVREWRAGAVMTEAQQTTMTPGLALMSLVWVSACGGLALGSSRWR